MKTLDNKRIVYDSNCKVCSSLKEVVLALTPIPSSKVIAYRDLSCEWTPKADRESLKYNGPSGQSVKQ